MSGKKRLAAPSGFDAFRQPGGEKPFGFLNAGYERTRPGE
jgi:hypothetical protein